MEVPAGREAGGASLLTRHLSPLFLKSVRMDRAYFRRCLEQHPRLIIVLAHGGPLSFLPAVSALLAVTAEYDPTRRQLATFHPWWWKVPVARSVARYLGGGDQHHSLQDLHRALGGQSSVDYYALPESEYCFYGHPSDVKPFRFHGFIELSIATKSPMLLVVHAGSEAWHRQIDCSGRLFHLFTRLPERAYHAVELNKEIVLSALEHYRYLCLPLPLGRLDMRLNFELHYPDLYETGMSSEYRERRRQVTEEGERIRSRMQRLYSAL